MVGGMVLCAVGDIGTGLELWQQFELRRHFGMPRWAQEPKAKATSLPFLILARLLLGAGLSSSDAGASAWVADATAAWPRAAPQVSSKHVRTA